ncbi:uncharacterized protein EAE98_003388 [Botrytis deweyae]|uniref:BTB domain-containing protein n=1 Tax=Botrytis deweyae TaxID=2478750 RepID=A0ABQ7ITE0_9HELO|nr:uncharacterized protein EAE98_003388 [Botrytis deweyae]KAF7933679.1 hypothetical protein EAE98_003388 [Botrytis deweyae]
MASDTPETPEKLIFDAAGEVLLIFTHLPVDRDGVEADNDSVNSHKRKAHCDKSYTVTMLVSSKHLKLASPVFGAMLKHDRFKEGIELQANGEVKISLPDDDPIAFAIIANVIHHRNKLVPEHVAPMLLAKITLLTEKYQMHEAMSLVTKCWTSLLGEERDAQYTSITTGGLVYLAYFQYKPLEFKKHTRRAIVCNDENFADWMNEHGCWPYTIVEKIKEARLKAFGGLFSILGDLVRSQIANETCDEYDLCDQVTIGFLMQVALESRLYPFPKAPYQGLDLKSIFKKISHARIDTRCTYEGSLSTCENSEMFFRMQVEMEQFESKIEGLDLESFRSSPE